ncbi:hypothetical protein QR90_04305 [Deinococcus radiopugnans]|uniref:Uncharacterized protein n=2 Tax=Deinococcus radiopugnans TaxID=57497 RepID=A0A0A7KGY3_9DEIO|nr:hypothetical protein [Deinococcus radiopugnans]AIZ44484.1 hypothetical protein QR90_04305 [Deinococcus radiopugnans]MBB6016234.1 hypothetical protein [Deinococcus radiopugnans ATCC 19172]QLG10101.1 hypothetical protein HLB42_04460 [Deinococcus sp. D7000]TNM72247.1 hypothetical protein FHR04_05345 [Deinococcus radiopugnans ATCC 19172]
MTDPKTPPGKGRTSVPTEALLRAVRDASERLTRFSRDPEVRREAGNVAQAVGRLLDAIRKAGAEKGR